MKVKKIFIENYKVFKNFEIDFCDDDGSPLNLIVIAGINGSGKTSLLEYIGEKISNAVKNDEQGYLHISTEFEDVLLENIKSLSEIKISQNSFENIANYQQNNSKTTSEKIPLVYADVSSNLKAIPENLEPNYIQSIANLPQKIIYLKTEEINVKDIKNYIFNYVKQLIFKENKTPQNATIQVQELLDSIFENFQLKIAFSGIDTIYNNGKESFEVYFKNHTNDHIPIQSLSTGEKELITKVFYLELLQPKNAIVLIDEPERSLHPSWQQGILDIYKQISQKNDNQLIVATHSPHIIAATDPNKVYILEVTSEMLGTGKYQINERGEELEVLEEVTQIYNYKMSALNKKTIGLEPNRILSEIMGVSSLRYYAIENKMKAVINLLDNDKWDTQAASNLIHELLAILGENDPFMIRLNHQLRILQRKRQKQS